MRKLRNTILLAVLTVTMFSLCSCSTYDNFVHQFFHKAGATDETIKIGIIEPQTGRDSSYGTEELRGFKIANELVPEVLGKKIELLYADTQSDMDVAETTVAGVIDKKPAVVLGGYGNVVSLVASSLLGQARIPAIGTTATNPLIADNNSYYYRVAFTDSVQGKLVADYIVDSMKEEKAILIKIKGDETTTPMNGKFLNRMESRTGNSDSVKDIIYVDQASADYRLYVDTIAKDNVHAVFMATGLNVAEEVFKEADKKLTGVTFIGPNSWHNDDLLNIALKYPNIRIAVVSDVVNTAVNSEQMHELQDVETTSMYDQLAAKYAEQYGPDAQIPTGTALAFDAYMIAVKAIRDAGSVEAADIKAQLDSITDFPGASGQITFNENGEASKPINIDIVDRNKFVTVYTSK